MSAFQPGDIIRVQRIKHLPPEPSPVGEMEVWTKPDKVYVLMYLGSEALDESEALDVKTIMRDLVDKIDWDVSGIQGLTRIPMKEG